MQIKWQVKFKTLRGGRTLTVSIYDLTYTGQPILLKGGEQPFVTEESSDDDPFTPIRTQTGHLRIVDDGYAADGTTPFDWKAFVPQTDHSRPVVLTDDDDNVLWQGFMQAQDFSGELYGNPQEREFPVHCAVSVMSSQQPSTSSIQRRNFAYVIDLIAATAEALSVQTVGFDTFYVQGSTDAQTWLLKQFEWMNVLKEGDDGEDVAPQYNLYEILEDICRFWGWTCRTKGRTMYFTCADDSDEQLFLTMTRAQLRQMVLGNRAGTLTDGFIPATLDGNIFASTDNDDMKRRGPSKATVKSDCNSQDTIFEFAPPSVEKLMDQTGYTWVAGEEQGTGYFTTTPIRSFDTLGMKGDATQKGGFCRRQIYSDADSDSVAEKDMFTIDNTGYDRNTPIISLQSKKAMNYTGGSLKIKGDVYVGTKRWDYNWANDLLWVRIGIGLTKATAKWFYVMGDEPVGHITHRWQSTPASFASWVHNGGFTGCNVVLAQCNYIPCDDNLYGYLFIDICGMNMFYEHEETSFEIGDFVVDFTRDKTFFPTSTTDVRSRTMVEKRINSLDYMAVNTNGCGDEWNCDCIYASDNNMEYGYGLIINPSDGSFVETVGYGNQQEHPEQHLANRVAAFWQSSKRQVVTELRTEAIPDVTPRHRLTLETAWKFDPIAISHDWRDDVTTITLLQSPIS